MSWDRMLDSADPIALIYSSEPFANRTTRSRCFISGRGLQTTGFPAARYSYSFSGELDTSVRSFRIHGMTQTSQPFKYPGISVCLRLPMKCTFGRLDKEATLA